MDETDRRRDTGGRSDFSLRADAVHSGAGCSPFRASLRERPGTVQRGFERMATNLNLTEAQKTEAKAILKQSHEAARQFAPQLKQNREALAAAVKANNAAEIERLSAERGNLMGKMTALHSEAFAKIYQGLTPEQRTKADQMKEHFRGMHQRRQGRSQADKS